MVINRVTWFICLPMIAVHVHLCIADEFHLNSEGREDFKKNVEFKEEEMKASLQSKESLPLNTIDKVIQVFVDDNDSDLKAHAVDVLYKWLPNHPDLQARVMKTTSLEAFYQQIERLDIKVVKHLMDLFNIILKEHINVRRDKALKGESKVIKMYERMGFLEYVSDSRTCNGLLNIVEILMPQKVHDNDNMKTVFQLLHYVMPYCGNLYRKDDKAIELFMTLSSIVNSNTWWENMENTDLNISDAMSFIKDFLKQDEVTKVIQAKDEF